jgi:hypothetical protein
MKRKLLMEMENETKSRLNQVKKTTRASVDSAPNDNEFDGLTTDYNGYPIAINQRVCQNGFSDKQIITSYKFTDSSLTPKQQALYNKLLVVFKT